MTNERFLLIQDTIGYHFKTIDLLVQAFTRKSYAEENGGNDNEVLEFIGDKVLDICVVRYLTDSFGSFSNENSVGWSQGRVEFQSEYDEGKLTRMKANLVQKRTLSHRMDCLGFAEFLRMGQGDIERHMEQQSSVKEDLFEAILGAVALDSNWDMEKMQNVVEQMLCPETELETCENRENYVSKVQDWALKKHGVLPRYQTERYSMSYIYYRANYIYGENKRIINSLCQPKRLCKLFLPNIDACFIDSGESNREAIQGAAKAAYEYLVENELLYNIRDEIENPNREDSISQLEILARKKYIPMPTYGFEEDHDCDGNPIWKCECRCEVKKKVKTTNGQSSVKKDAKKKAAYKMLKYVLKEC
jgi:ribonuclease-3